MNRRVLSAIIRKDLEVVLQSKPVMIPLILLPALLFILIPVMAIYLPTAVSLPGGTNIPHIQEMLKSAPESLQAALAGYGPFQLFTVWMLTYLMAPMFLIVPLMVASVIAADSFAGEKERKTLEALLYTPTSDTELFAAKVLAAWLPAVAVALVGFVLYSAVADLVAFPVVGKILLPNAIWATLVLWVAPPAAGLGLSAMVIVSSRVKTFQEAYQIGGVVVLPVVLLILGQASGVVYLTVPIVFALGLIFWLVDLLLLWIGIRSFRRAELIARM